MSQHPVQAQTERLIEDIRQSRQVFIVGNGGSAANAMHIENDLISSGVRARALSSNVAMVTAIGNDEGYQHVYSHQLAILADPGDLLLALSGSGESPNILMAIGTARTIGMKTWAVVGRKSSAAVEALEAIVYGQDMQSAEEFQLRLGHQLRAALMPA